MAYNAILNKDKEILLNVVNKEKKNINYSDLSKKTGTSLKYLKLLFGLHHVFIEDVLKMCKLLDIDIEKYIDIKELNKAIDDYYISDYISLSDFSKLRIISYIESQSKCGKKDTTYKINDELLDKIINNGELTMDEISKKIDMSNSLLNSILNKEASSFGATNRICNTLGINLHNYINYNDYKDILVNGRLNLFSKMDPITKLDIIEYEQMLPEVEKKENYLRYIHNKDKEKKLTLNS